MKNQTENNKNDYDKEKAKTEIHKEGAPMDTKDSCCDIPKSNALEKRESGDEKHDRMKIETAVAGQPHLDPKHKEQSTSVGNTPMGTDTVKGTYQSDHRNDNHKKNHEPETESRKHTETHR